MMNYEMFREIVKEKIRDFLPGEMKGMEVNFHRVHKVNEIRDAISFVDPNKRICVSPTLYINDIYAHYQKNEDMRYSIGYSVNEMLKAMDYGKRFEGVLGMENAKENIVFQLINTEQNQQLLNGIPHREFQDLSLVYRWVVERDSDGIASSIVTDHMAEMMGFNEEQLYKLAVENTKRLFPPSIKTMREVICEILEQDGVPKEMADIMLGEVPEEDMMYVITNEQKTNGAVSMLYEDGLHELAARVNDDLYILPSSVHEVIAVRAKDMEPNELAEMVSEINMAQVSLNDRLSNQVYHYDRDLRKLTLATDTPNKRLDGMVAEPKLIYEVKEQSR